jgi:Lrp/AsnC family transcriptional regulator, regulator for asnA, asnC and gidA
MKIDHLDERIVRALGKDARQTSEDIAKELKVSSATIRRRFNKLITGGKLKVIGVVRPEDFGYTVSAVVTLRVKPELVKIVSDQLSKYPETIWVSTTTGRYDIICGIRFKNIDDLADFVTTGFGRLEGVKDSETFILLSEKKNTFAPLI